jgi:hypothetical protein
MIGFVDRDFTSSLETRAILPGFGYGPLLRLSEEQLTRSRGIRRFHSHLPHYCEVDIRCGNDPFTPSLLHSFTANPSNKTTLSANLRLSQRLSPNYKPENMSLSYHSNLPA